jgi:hypothetical protein
LDVPVPTPGSILFDYLNNNHYMDGEFLLVYEELLKLYDTTTPQWSKNSRLEKIFSAVRKHPKVNALMNEAICSKLIPQL